MCEGRRRAESLKKTSDGLAPLALFETIAAQFAPNPLVQTLEFEPACRKTVVGQPTNEKQVEFDNYLRKTDAPVSTGNLPDSLLRVTDSITRCPAANDRT